MSRKVFILLFDGFVNDLCLEAVSGVSAVATVPVGFLHGKI